MSKSPYTGSQIDEALRKASTMRIVNNGWILLESSEAKPVNLNTLVNPGNYSVNYWTNGPSSRDELGYPASVTVVNIANILYQFFTIGSTSYNRKSGEGDQDFGAWNINQSAGAMNPGSDAPSAPVDGKTTWLDTTDPNNPTFKLYLNGGWVEIIPAGLMQATVYDPSGRRTDIFAYIDAEIAKLDPALVEMDFSQHINDQTIHVTNEEKEKWNNNATKQDIEDKIHELGPEITSKTEEVIGEDLIKIDQLSNDIKSLEESLNLHIEDTTIHPSLEKQSEWDSKAAGDHQHILDGKVKITVDDIEGEIGDTLIPFTLKERVYIVTSEEERLKLQFNPTHNGDAVCVTNSGSEDKWYFVVDEKYLGQYDPEMSDQITVRELGKDWVSNNLIGLSRVNYISITTNGSIYVAVSGGYYLSDRFAYSGDGVTWTEVICGNTTRYWFNVCYGDGKFIAISTIGIEQTGSVAFAYSTDGINWTETTSGIDVQKDYARIIYANNKYVTIAASPADNGAYSTDGINWTMTSVGGSRGWGALRYGKNLYVALANMSTYSSYSSDGITWTEASSSIVAKRRHDMTFNGNRFIASSYNSQIFSYSDDGITWTDIDTLLPVKGWIGCATIGGLSVVVSNTSKASIAYTTDGIEWFETYNGIVSSAYYSVCANMDKFVAISYSAPISIYSKSETIVKFVAGVNWEKKNSESLPVRQWSGIAISDDNNTIVAISSNTNSVVYSTDHGSTWNTSDTILSDREWSSIIFANDKFVMVAANSDTFAYSSDGITWTETSDGLISQNWSSLAYGANKFVAIAANSDTFAYSSDGVSWQTTSTGILSNLSYSDISYSTDKFFVCAKNSNTVLYSDDGISWHATNDGISNREWIKACFGNNRYLLVAANSNTFAYSNNGIRWYETTVGIDGDSINWTDVIFGNGRFVAISAGNNNRVIYSFDGYYWNESEWESDNKNWRCITWNGNESTYLSLNDSDNNVGISKTYYNEYIKTEIGKNWEFSSNMNPPQAGSIWTIGCYNDIYIYTPYNGTGEAGADRFIYSLNGDTWTELKLNLYPDLVGWGGITYGNDKFIAAPQREQSIAYSTDGINWTKSEIVSDSKKTFWRCIYGKNKYIVITGGGDSGSSFFYSTDGISWTETSSGISGYRWYDICASEDKYVVCNYGDSSSGSKTSIYSTDGINWTTSSSLSMRSWTTVCYADGKYIATCDNWGGVAYSTDGIVWSDIYFNIDNLLTYYQWSCSIYAAGLFLVSAWRDRLIGYSKDCINWKFIKMNSEYFDILYNGTILLSISTNGSNIAKSISGIENFPLPDPYVAPAEKAYRKVLSGASSINWQNVSDTPTTLAGYGITDAASDEDLEKISQEISEVQQNIPSDVDLSNAVEAQTTYNELLTNLSIIDSIFSTLDSTIASLESVVS